VQIARGGLDGAWLEAGHAASLACAAALSERRSTPRLKKIPRISPQVEESPVALSVRSIWIPFICLFPCVD
jgi:hypothetical protein